MHLIKGNIFDSKCDTITNPINTVGTMGAGLALQFKNRYPELNAIYKELCSSGLIVIGKPCIVYDYECGADKQIILFPTKIHWRHPSKIEWIKDGLNHLALTVDKNKIKSIAFPLLGAGLGGLDKNKVLLLIEEFEKISNINCEVWEI